MFDNSLKYRLAISLGYKSNIAKIGGHSYDPSQLENKANYPDLEITRPGIPVDMSEVYSRCLFTINGFLYPSLHEGNSIYIPNATHNLLKSRSNQVGIISSPSHLVTTKIEPEMITTDGNIPLFKKAIITFPEEVDTCILSLAGYPVFEQPEFFYRVSPTSFVLRLDRLDYVDRLYELNRYTNIFDDLGVENSINNPSMLDGNMIRSNLIVERFLSLHNSFIVEFPGRLLEPKRIYLEHSNVPGNFRTEVEPVLPMVGGKGKFIEYMSSKKNSIKYTIHTTDAYTNNHLYSKFTRDKLSMYNDHREPGRTYYLSQGFFLDVKVKDA